MDNTNNKIAVTAVMCLAALTFLLGYSFGKREGTAEIHYRDHVQAQAGVFIDGYDKNKVYRIVPAAGDKGIGN